VIRGVDVSSHQVPSQIDWHALALTHGFAICRAAYGMRPDTRCLEHISRAQEVGLFVGLYLFYRPGDEIGAQIATFEHVAEMVGMGSGFLLPALDVEKNLAHNGAFTAERYVEQCEAIAAAFKRLHGGCLVYTNPNEWGELGSPRWILEHQLWLAHHDTDAPEPPLNMAWTIWQHKVEPLPGVYEREIDQDLCGELPLIEPAREPETEPAPADDAVLLPLEIDIDEMRADRDATIKDREGDDD
jgi:GH25 family lysozyme M1 (1,4-beta-N-acetylmuramidase)